MNEASPRLKGDGEGQGAGRRETHLVPHGHLAVVPPGCACGQQLLQVPQKQHFVGPVPLVAGFLDSMYSQGLLGSKQLGPLASLPWLMLRQYLECLLYSL